MHALTLICEHENTQEWVCPICGRIVLIELSPWHRAVVVAGDETVSHSGWVTEGME